MTSCGLVALLFVATHDPMASLHTESPVDDLVSIGLGGAVFRQAALGLIGILGFFNVLRGRDPLRLFRSAAGRLLLALVLWATLSLVWSHEPTVTLRALGSSGAMLLFAIGFMNVYGATALLRLSFTASLTYLVVGVIAEVSLGVFHPWLSEYRFAGSLNSNHQAINCAILLFAAAALARRARRFEWLCWTLSIIAGAFLLLTKSRTSVASVAVALVLLLFVHLWRSKTIAALIAACVIGVASLLYAIFGLSPSAPQRSFLLLGREDAPISDLSGRSKLWDLVTPYISSQKWCCGYGYNTFWTPERHAEISEEAGWGVFEGHSAYLDVFLGLGGIGLGVYLSLIVVGCGTAVCRYGLVPSSESAFVLLVITFSVFHGVTESALLHPTLLQLTFLSCALNLRNRDARERENLCGPVHCAAADKVGPQRP
jgi:O-antigen ligase